MNPAALPTVEGVTVFDLYQGAGLPEGKKSLAFNLVFRAADRTLTDEEAEEARARIVQGLKREFGVIPR